jgi:hypothetical protein
MLHPSDADLAYMRAHADDNRVPLFVGVNAMCVGMVYVAIFLRFTSRMKIRTKIGLDDWLIALAAVSRTLLQGRYDGQHNQKKETCQYIDNPRLRPTKSHGCL